MKQIAKCVLFSSGSPSSAEGSSRRLFVYEHCISLCESGDLHSEVAQNIIRQLMLGVMDVKFTLSYQV